MIIHFITISKHHHRQILLSVVLLLKHQSTAEGGFI
jgi:hypothetical protein